MARIYPEEGIPVKKFDKKEVNKYFRRLSASFKTINYIKLQNLPGKRGLWVSQGSTRFILLDPREPLLPTLIHEMCHNLFEDLCEKDILTLEYSLVNVISTRQYKRFAELMMEKLRV